MIRLDMPQEEWRPCCDGFYEASSMGRIRRLAKDAIGRDIQKKVKKPTTHHRDGRLYVKIHTDGEVRNRQVHTLVMEAFHGPPSPGLEVNHRNGDPADNRLSNLEYVTRSENVRHAVRIGKHKSGFRKVGVDNPRAKLNPELVREMRAKRESGSSTKDLAEEFGVCTSTVDYVTRRVYWSHVK